jgi:antitoxin component YwqK of YwqJK toxin-antitoxin module
MKTPIRILSFLAIFLFTHSSWAQPGTLTNASNNMVAGVAGVDYNNINSSGEKQGLWIRVWPNGNLYYKGQFSNGTPIGSFLYFYETGELMSSLEHSDQITTAIHYRLKGSISAFGNYLPAVGDAAPRKNGAWGFVNDNAVQIRLETFADGELDGEYWVRDYKGRTVEAGAYSANEKHGLWSTYYDNDAVRQEVNYSNGELEGSFTTFHPNTNPKIKGQYLEGQEDGSWKTYADTGELELIIKYSYGKRIEEIRINGTYEEIFIDGRSKSEYTYRDKELDGPYRIWFDCGEYMIEAFNDPETGELLQKRVLVGDQVQEEGSYTQGKLDGPRYVYDIKGRLIDKENYLNGVLQEQD